MRQEKSLAKFFYQQLAIAKDRDSVGYVEKGKLYFYTFGEFADQVELITFAFWHWGIRPQEKIAILAQTSYQWHLFDLGILFAQCVVVPIYPNYLKKEITFILGNGEVSAVVVENAEQLATIISLLPQLPQLKLIIGMPKVLTGQIGEMPLSCAFISYADFLSQGALLKDRSPDRFKASAMGITPEQQASIIYTSGTTGDPKGAVITHGALTTMLTNVQVSIGDQFSSEDRNLTFLPLAHVLGRADSLLHLVLGWETVFAEGIDHLMENLALVQPTVILAVPRVYEKIYQGIFGQLKKADLLRNRVFQWALSVANTYYEKLDRDQTPTTLELSKKHLAFYLVFSTIHQRFGGRLRYCVSGGAPLNIEVVKFLRNLNMPILEGYGLTETIGPCFLNPLYKQIPGTVGVPLGDVQIKIAKDGEILLHSRAMMSEYFNNPAANEEAYIEIGSEKWLKTGDLGILTAEGFLQITGRKKDLIITSGGKNVSPQKIENIMMQHRAVAHLLVIGDQRNYLTVIVGIDEKLRTSMEPKGLEQLLRTAIEEGNRELAQFEKIKKFFIAPNEFSLATGELTPSLKLKRQFLLKKYQNIIDAMYADGLTSDKLNEYKLPTTIISCGESTNGKNHH